MLWCLLASLQGCTLNQDNSCTWTQPFTSARIRTAMSPIGSWKYGRVEVRAQMPRGDFLWPAIWMLPTGELAAVRFCGALEPGLSCCICCIVLDAAAL